MNRESWNGIKAFMTYGLDVEPCYPHYSKMKEVKISVQTMLVRILFPSYLKGSFVKVWVRDKTMYVPKAVAIEK